MTSRNVGPKRRTDSHSEAPAELAQREAQDRAKPTPRNGGAKSPVDAMHVDAPKHQDNARGHRRDDRS